MSETKPPAWKSAGPQMLQEMREVSDAAHSRFPDTVTDWVFVSSARLDAWIRWTEEDVRRLAELEAAMKKIDDLRNDIVGTQSVGFSRHVYPLVAILNDAGFEGLSYEEAKAKAVSKSTPVFFIPEVPKK